MRRLGQSPSGVHVRQCPSAFSVPWWTGGDARHSITTCTFGQYHSIFIYMPQIQIPSPLRQYSGKQASIDVAAKTVGEALAGLVSQHPDLKRPLYPEQANLPPFLTPYANLQHIPSLQHNPTALQ